MLGKLGFGGAVTACWAVLAGTYFAVAAALGARPFYPDILLAHGGWCSFLALLATSAARIRRSPVQTWRKVFAGIMEAILILWLVFPILTANDESSAGVIFGSLPIIALTISAMAVWAHAAFWPRSSVAPSPDARLQAAAVLAALLVGGFGIWLEYAIP